MFCESDFGAEGGWYQMALVSGATGFQWYALQKKLAEKSKAWVWIKTYSIDVKEYDLKRSKWQCG